MGPFSSLSRRVAAIAAGVALPLAIPAATAPAAQPDAPVPEQRVLYQDGPDGRYLLDQGWTTRADPGEVGLNEGWQAPGDEGGFTPVTIPNSFNADQLDARGFKGSVQWYRVRFTLPDDAAAVTWRLRFESVGVGAMVFLNGRLVGRHRGAALPFEVPASGIAPGVNELVVRVDGRSRASDLPPSGHPRGWWNFAGILREVYLRRVGALDIERLRVRVRTGPPGRVSATALVRNASGQPVDAAFEHVDLRGGGEGVALRRSAPAPIAPGGHRRISTTITIPRPRLWSPGAPNLYELRLAVPGGQVWTVHVGLRRWGHDRQGRLLLNGRPLVLRGASFHEQVPGRGAALEPSDRQRIIDELRAVGANATRAHYPPHPALLEAFDRLGIVFWEQIPVWRLPGRVLGAGPVRRTALSTLRQAVLRDRNHASVMAWSVENETQRGGAGQVSYVNAARSLVRHLDPTRLVAADATLPLSSFRRIYHSLDAIGINEYLGWYDAAPPQAVGSVLRALRAHFPSRVLVVTEFGAEANRAQPAGRKGTYAFQRAFLAAQLAQIQAAPRISGALVWALRDFAVRPGWKGGNPRPDPPWNHKGLFDVRGDPKPALGVVRAQFARATRREP